MNNKFEALNSDSDEVADVDKTDLPPVIIPEDENRLQYVYGLWFSKRTQGKQPQSYDQQLKLVGRFGTVEQFWGIYSHIIKPSQITGHADFHLFKDGIKPMWEDSANKQGGKWIVRLRKGLADRCWENLILAILGEQFMVGNEICGAVMSIRYQTKEPGAQFNLQEDIISIWNRNARDHQTTGRIRDTLRRVLNLPPNTIMEYKLHTDSLKDHSSFRNTDLFIK